jgi:sarcosine oxidase
LKCIVAYVKQAQKVGAHVHAREELKDWKVSPTGTVSVVTNKSEYTARNIIFTAGSWSSHILDCFSKDQLKVERQVTAWFQPKVKISA